MVGIGGKALKGQELCFVVTFGYCPLLAVVNGTTMNMCVDIYALKLVLIIL